MLVFLISESAIQLNIIYSWLHFVGLHTVHCTLHHLFWMVCSFHATWIQNEIIHCYRLWLWLSKRGRNETFKKNVNQMHNATEQLILFGMIHYHISVPNSIPLRYEFPYITHLVKSKWLINPNEKKPKKREKEKRDKKKDRKKMSQKQ